MRIEYTGKRYPTIHAYCPHCESEILFDFGGIINGPGLPRVPEVNDLVEKKCDCPMTEAEIESAQEWASENYLNARFDR
jgi:hypothetical protein